MFVGQKEEHSVAWSVFATDDASTNWLTMWNVRQSFQTTSHFSRNPPGWLLS
jgi:hypothetical protein